MGLSDALIRLGMLVLALLLIAALVWGGRLFVERQRRLALAAAPLAGDLLSQHESKIRILAFSSRPCAAYRRCEGVRSMWWRLMRLAHLNWLVTIAFSLCPAPSCSTQQARHSRPIMASRI